MKIFIYLLIVTNGFSVVLAYDDKCEINDLNALMVRLRQLKTEFHNLKVENIKQTNESKEEISRQLRTEFQNLKVENDKLINANKEEISRQLRTEFHNLTIEYDQQINTNKEEISNLKEVNEKQATEMLEYDKQINESKEEISHLKEINEKLATEMLEYNKQINESKEEISRQLRTEFHNLTMENKKQINTNKEEISNLKEVNENQATEMLKLEEEIRNKSQEIERIKGLYSTRVPAFIVHLEEEVHYNCTTKIPFGTIFLNVGDAYDNTTNHFKAPLAGLYMFTAQLCTNRTYYYYQVSFSINSYTNNKTHGDSWFGPNTYCSTLTTLANLTANEEVYLQVECPGTEIIIDQPTMFTGTLLSPEL